MYKLYNGDCLEIMPTLEAGSIDAIITDLPYGTTACKWDTIIPFEPMWKEVKRVLKPNGTFITTASQPFTSILIMSNFNWFKYCQYWKKTKAVGFQHAKNKPMFIIEDVCVFSPAPMGHKSLLGERRMTYNPQGIKSIGEKTVLRTWHGNMMGARPNQVGKKYEAFTGYPNNLLEFNQPIGIKSLHPTQKPVALYEYLIKTYTNEGETVLDIAMGSGTTIEAAERTGRNSIGIEKDPDIFKTAQDRILHMCDAPKKVKKPKSDNGLQTELV